MTPPLVVVEGAEVAARHAVEEVAAAGWTTTAGFAAPHRSGRIVRTGIVATVADAEAALLAALVGQGLAIQATAERDVIDRLIDGLRRLGRVDHRVGPPDAGPTLSSDARAILDLLAEGHSLGEAAAILGLSRRTADRRLAEGRATLGVERTTEAISRAKRLGGLDRPARP